MKRLKNCGCFYSFIVTESRITATLCETIVFAKGRGNIQVDQFLHTNQFYQFFNHHALLIILLSDVKIVWFYNFQQAVNYHTHSLEMTRSVLSFENGIKISQVIMHYSFCSLRIHFSNSGKK